MDQRLVTITDYAMKALGSNEALPSEGGFLMQPDFSGEVIKKAYDNSVLASRVRKIPISSASNGIRINAIDETSRVAGSRWGGVQAYWLAEATAPTASKPKFRQLDLKLEKLAILMYATEEVLQDSSALNAIFMEAGAEEIAFMTDKSIFDGAGAGMPLGMLASLARIDVAKETGQVAATVVAENVVKMWSRMWAPSRPSSIWLINQDVEPFLDLMAVTVGLGGYPVYMPPGGIADAPYGRLKGRPVILFENSSTVGTLGDIMLVDPQQYLLADKGGPDFQSSIHVAFTTDEIAFRLIYRVDGEPIWNSALTPAKGTNTLSPYVALAARA
jgi:HK97 family phage major capsid protein